MNIPPTPLQSTTLVVTIISALLHLNTRGILHTPLKLGQLIALLGGIHPIPTLFYGVFIAERVFHMSMPGLVSRILPGQQFECQTEGGFVDCLDS